MTRYRAYLFDLDGTVYRGAQLVPHAAETIRHLLDSGAAVRYLTNNSGSTRRQIADKLANLGIPCEPDWVQCTAEAARTYFCERSWTRGFVVGDPGLHLTLEEAGVSTDDVDSPDAVLVGICRSMTYGLLRQAMQLIQSGVPFVATNTDASYPLADGRFEPGAGSIVAAVSVSSGKQPIVLGKPEPYMVQNALRDLGLQPSEAIVVGDRVETDLAAGERAGCDTWLVLTGVTDQIPTGQRGSDDLRGLLE